MDKNFRKSKKMNKILVLSNDKLFFSKGNVFSNYHDTLSLIGTISKKFQIYLFSRNANVKQTHVIKNNKIKKFFIKDLFRLKKLDLKLFLISINPLNFFFFIILSFFLKKIDGYVYIRSDGFKEYFSKYGYFGKYFYYIMYKIISRKLRVISVGSNLTHVDTKLILFPSEITNSWKKKKINLFNNKKIPKLLYFGRFRREKGIYSLIEIFRKINSNIQLTLAGDVKMNFDHENLNYIGRISNIKKIIKLYDQHDIIILPSFTEGHPKVILESLIRGKPVIIFPEIKHVIQNFKGIYVSQRNCMDLKKKVRFIMKNYESINKKILKNKIITKKDFQKDLLKILLCK